MDPAYGIAKRKKCGIAIYPMRMGKMEEKR